MHECIGSVLKLERPISSCSLDGKGKEVSYVRIYWTFVLHRRHSGITRKTTLTISVARCQYIIFRIVVDSFYFRTIIHALSYRRV